MVSRPADYCPSCGEPLEQVTVDGRSREYCPECEEVVWHNPVPCASVAVVDRASDDTAVLCVKRGVPPGVGEWTLPGGHMEIGEEPEATAARELAEEAGVVVDPDALELFGAATMAPRDGKHVVTIHYVVDRRRTDGEPTPGSDASAAGFWSPAEFDATSETFRPVHESRFRTAAEWQPR